MAQTRGTLWPGSIRAAASVSVPETHLPETHDSAIPNIGIRISEIEQAFKELKGDLAFRPIHHQLEERIEAHIFISFMACCLQVAL